MNDSQNKPVLALIPGWGVGHAAWEPVLPMLSEWLDILRIELPTGDRAKIPCDALPGDANTSRASFAEAASIVAAQLPEGCFLGGWSLGALLALHIAHEAPRRIKGLILVGATPSFTQRAGWPFAQPPALLDTFCNAVREDAAGTLQRFIALLNQGDTLARTISRAMNRRVLAAELPDGKALQTGLGWLRDIDLRRMIAAIDTPTLLIHGEHDSLMPLAAACWLQETLPNAQLDTFPGAAHAPFLNDPDRFARLLGDFIHASAHN